MANILLFPCITCVYKQALSHILKSLWFGFHLTFLMLARMWKQSSKMAKIAGVTPIHSVVLEKKNDFGLQGLPFILWDAHFECKEQIFIDQTDFSLEGVCFPIPGICHGTSQSSPCPILLLCLFLGGLASERAPPPSPLLIVCNCVCPILWQSAWPPGHCVRGSTAGQQLPGHTGPLCRRGGGHLRVP